MNSCGFSKRALELGRDIGEYLERRTRDDPMFLMASLVLHSGNVPYDQQQLFVERIVKLSPEERKKLVDPEFAYQILTGYKVNGTKHSSYANQMSRKLAEVARCYFDHCGDSKEQCNTLAGAGEFMRCSRKVTGIGNKIVAMGQEYLGDKDAVALDTHVQKWLMARLAEHDENKYDEAKKITKWFWKGRSEQRDRWYARLLELFKEEATRCGMGYREAQLPAWLLGACADRMKKKDPSKRALFIGDGMYVDCSELEKQRQSVLSEEW